MKYVGLPLANIQNGIPCQFFDVSLQKNGLNIERGASGAEVELSSRIEETETVSNLALACKRESFFVLSNNHIEFAFL